MRACRHGCSDSLAQRAAEGPKDLRVGNLGLLELAEFLAQVIQTGEACRLGDDRQAHMSDARFGILFNPGDFHSPISFHLLGEQKRELHWRDNILESPRIVNSQVAC